MNPRSFLLPACLGLTLALSAAPAQPPAEKKKSADALPHTKLAPAKLMPDLGTIAYRVSTTSPECQAYFDQGLRFQYSYVYMEAARAFETATKHDPDCAMAWWGLSRACEKWGKAPYGPPLKKAQELLSKASPREALLIKAKLHEKGMIEGVTQENRKKEAAKAIDELLALYEDDEEGWFARAQLAEGPNAAVPYYKALLRLNPDHAGAHHELVHHYENIRRPALGWPHAEGYVRSAPGIPHALHMQAHLAMRIGKWDRTTDRSARAVELEEAYHKFQGVKPKDDAQFTHHLETLMHALLHDGRFKEARALKAKCEGYKVENKTLFFHLALAERDWDAALAVAGKYPKDKVTASYLRAKVFLHKGDFGRAAPEVAVLQEAYAADRKTKDLEPRLWETLGALQVGQGQPDGGLKLLAKVADRSKTDYKQHAWGHGAYYMEAWGLAALRANRLDAAEEAFLEALAHDAGSARGALGMQVVCERQGRTEEAARFAALARRCWAKADPGALEAELTLLRGKDPELATTLQQ